MVRTHVVTLIACGMLASCGAHPKTEPVKQGVVEGVATSADGTPIAYSTAGRGDTTLVFIHGGFGDSSFWKNQLEALSDQYQVVTLDLAGRGASGSGRKKWGLATFAEDVSAVIAALHLKRVVLLGNSMGGPIALEVARTQLEGVIAVIGVASLHDADTVHDQTQWKAYVNSMRSDFVGTCNSMVGKLFYPSTPKTLVIEVRRKMCQGTGAEAGAILESFSNYNMAAAMNAVGVPIRCINGDLYPTNVKVNRKYAPGFDVIIMENTGQFPMLERPKEFNANLRTLLKTLVKK